MGGSKFKLVNVDERRWPLVVVTMPPRELTDDEFADHLLDIDELVKRGERFGMVIDGRTAPPPNAKRRRVMAETMDRNFALYGNRCFAIAIVMSSPVARGAFRALQWLRETKQPMTAVATPEEGLDWIGLVQSQSVKQAM